MTGGLGVEPPAKISDPPAAIKKTQRGGVDFLCTYALARSSTSIAKTSTPLMKFDKYSPAFEQDYVLFLSSPLHCFHQKLLIIVCCTAFYAHLFIHSWCDCLKSCWHRCRETKMKIYVIIELRAIEFDELSSIPVSRKEGLSLAVGVGGGRITCLYI